MAELSAASILVVDDDPQNLRILSAMLRRRGLVSRPTTSGRLAIEAARSDPPDLILLDVRMPDLSGFEVCERLKSDPATSGIPVVFLSGLAGTDDKVQAFDAGGVDYIAKPFQEREVIARIETHLELRALQTALEEQNSALEQRVARQVRDLTASQQATIFALAKLAEARDDETGRHIERVREGARVLAEQLHAAGRHRDELDAELVALIHETASLHDIGKVGVPDAVLLKPGKLTPEEFAQMQRHAVLGGETLSDVLRLYPGARYLAVGAEVARSHHERWDGRGYPDGLAGRAIPLSARIVALADFYDALTSDRPYRRAMPHDAVCAMIREHRGAHFDPDVVDAFAEVEAVFRRLGDRAA